MTPPVNDQETLFSEEETYFSFLWYSHLEVTSGPNISFTPLMCNKPAVFFYSTFQCCKFVCRHCTYITSYFAQTEGLTLWFYNVQKRLGPRGGSCTQGSDPTLCCIHHSLQQGHTVFGAAVGAGNHLAS